MTISGFQSLNTYFFAKYRQLWSSLFDNPVTAKMLEEHWSATLSEMGEEKVRNAIENLQFNEKFEKYPPSTEDFILLGQPSIPDYFDCYSAAIKGDWDFHPLVYPCAQDCDIHWLRSSSKQQGEMRFASSYKKFKKKYLRGESLPTPTLALPAPPDQPNENDWRDQITSAKIAVIERNLKKLHTGRSLHDILRPLVSFRVKLYRCLEALYGAPTGIPKLLQSLLSRLKRKYQPESTENIQSQVKLYPSSNIVHNGPSKNEQPQGRDEHDQNSVKTVAQLPSQETARKVA